MAKKLLMKQQVKVINGEVCLTAYKGTSAFQNEVTDPDPFRVIRIFRKAEPEFEFGNDYAEYFDGLSWKDGELIFEGFLTAENNRKFTYIDRDVEIGMVYAYWMAGAEGDPTGPVAVKVRDPEVWWSQKRISEEIADIKSEYPNLVRTECVGRSVQEREIQALYIGSANPSIALIGAVHAGESGAELILPAIKRFLSERGDLLSRVGIAVIPVVNVDQRESLTCGTPWYLRTNANGVDLNRNFPVNWETVEYGYGLVSSDPDSATYRGQFAASEPETQAVLNFLRNNTYDAVFSFHCLASICGMSFLAAVCGQEDKDYSAKCAKFATPYGRSMAQDNTIRTEQMMTFGTSAGSIPAWCYKNGGIPAFDLEINGKLEPEATAQCRFDKTDVPLLRKYQQRHFNGLVSVLELLAGI